MYETPRSLLEKRINEALGKYEETIVSDLIKLSLLKTNERDSSLLLYSEIFNLLGPDKFTALVNILDGKSLKFPSKEKFKDITLLAVCYYYKNVERKSWDEIKDILGKPDLNTIKLGIRINQLHSQLSEMMDKIINEETAKK